MFVCVVVRVCVALCVVIGLCVSLCVFVCVIVCVVVPICERVCLCVFVFFPRQSHCIALVNPDRRCKGVCGRRRLKRATRFVGQAPAETGSGMGMRSAMREAHARRHEAKTPVVVVV